MGISSWTNALNNLIVEQANLATIGFGNLSPTAPNGNVVGHLDMYRTKVLLYRTMVLMARLTKVRR